MPTLTHMKRLIARDMRILDPLSYHAVQHCGHRTCGGAMNCVCDGNPCTGHLSVGLGGHCQYAGQERHIHPSRLPPRCALSKVLRGGAAGLCCCVQECFQEATALPSPHSLPKALSHRPQHWLPLQGRL